MKKSFLLVLSFLFMVSLVWGQNVWINEIHYDNDGTDVNEAVEVVLENPGSYDLSDFTITPYNGNGGVTYGTAYSLDQFTVGTTYGNFVIYSRMYPGLQNGAPDGLALDYQGTLVSGQFLSYEGTITAANGPANGILSTDISVTEPGAIGESLQLSGTGTQYSSFTWQIPATATLGNSNNSQTLGSLANDQTTTVALLIAYNAADLASTEDTPAEAVLFFTLNIADPGTADGLPTYITNLRLTPYSSNTADWTDTIQGINIVNGATQVITGTQVITDTYIDIPITSGNLDIPDNGFGYITFSVYLNTSNIEDNKVLSFFIDADDHGFTADVSGSGFLADFGTDINSNNFTLTVTTSASGFISVPTNVTTNTDFSVTCGAVDENGNIDVDYSSTQIELYLESGSGILSGTGLGIGQTLVDGVYTWTDIQYDTAEDFVLHVAIQGHNWHALSGTITANPSSDWIINEILADPDAALGDANGDGSVNTSEDEFVEFINNSDASINISGWTISDGVSLRHIFATGTIITPHNAVVVFGGGTPTGSFGGATIATASTGLLGFNNGGDTVTLDNGSDTEIVTYTYGSEGGDNQSLTRDPDITGDFVKHSLANGSGGALFSPGTTVTGSPLPVTLTNFSTAVIMNEFVQVNWTTQSESSINNWQLFRSTDNNSEQVLLDTQFGTNTTEPTTYTFEDYEVEENITYNYYLEANEYDGTSMMWGPISAILGNSTTTPPPAVSMLQSNYPNPFNPNTTIMCDIKDGEVGTLTIYNARGQVVEKQSLDAGEHTLNWNGTAYGSGVYLYKLETESYTKTRKMIMIK